ncbi:oxysterol-binding protein-related protein 11 isoform X3 [Centruroides vittatus]|uniref:oxysterol-binding protein-related protein 11 isoform X3 n=1 Tax=Centruroides vittatus TaxID=120091 RepID=UPI00350FC05F
MVYHSDKVLILSFNAAFLPVKEFDVQEENKMRNPLEGLLFKYTNVVKGWQFRWFVLNPETGYLEYYMPEEKTKRPRGTVHLAGAVISPSDEDSELFILSSACGEVYKLRASDAKERQFWVNRLRAVAEYHTQNIAERNPPLANRDRVISDVSGNNKVDNKPPHNVYQTPPNIITSPISPVVNSIASVTDALSSVKDILQKTEKHYKALSKVMDDLPTSKSLDTDVLLLKATAHATILCLEQCYTILQHQQLAANFPSGLPVGATVEWVEPNRTPPLTRRTVDAYTKSPLVSVSSVS